MHTPVRVFVLACLMGCGLLAGWSSASAATINLLRENFNDVPLASSSDQVQLTGALAPFLPAGTDWDGTVNVRGEDNVINTAGGNNGFNGHFTSNFLVLGDFEGEIGGPPTGGGPSRIRIPFVIPANAVAIIISYRDFFNGVDSNDDLVDEFIVRVNGPGAGDGTRIEFLESTDDPGDFDPHTGIAAFLPVINDADPDTISPGDYLLVFRLNESAGAGAGNTNTAVGIDRIRVRALLLPEPGTWLLLVTGMAGLAGWRARHLRR